MKHLKEEKEPLDQKRISGIIMGGHGSTQVIHVSTSATTMPSRPRIELTPTYGDITGLATITVSDWVPAESPWKWRADISFRANDIASWPTGENYTATGRMYVDNVPEGQVIYVTFLGKNRDFYIDNTTVELTNT